MSSPGPALTGTSARTRRSLARHRVGAIKEAVKFKAARMSPNSRV